MTGQDEVSGRPPEGLTILLLRAWFKKIKIIIKKYKHHVMIVGGRKARMATRHIYCPPPPHNPLISHDHTPDAFRARWAFIRSESTRSKYCTWLGKYSFRVLMLDSGSISVWGNYYICLAAQITHECSNFAKHVIHLWNTTDWTIAIRVISIVTCDGKNE